MKELYEFLEGKKNFLLEGIRKCLIDSKTLKLGLKEEIDFEHGHTKKNFYVKAAL